jgi:hypothetical protein
MERSPYQKPQGEDVAGTARRAAEQAREKAQELGHRAVEQAKSTAESAKQRAESMADEGRNRLAGRIEGVARALKRTASTMQEEDDKEVSNIADQLGTQIEKVSGWLQEHDTRDIIWRVENFARRQPAVFLGGAFVLGLAAARFLKSSAARRHQYEIQDYDIQPPEHESGYYGEYEKVAPQPTIPVTGQYGAEQSSQASYTQPQGTPSQASQSQPAMPGTSSNIRRP